MKIENHFLSAFLICLLIIPVSSASANTDQYRECRHLAERATGYYGPVPEQHAGHRNGLLKGAAKGALAGAAIGWVGGSKAKKAAKRGAGIGALIGLAKHEKAKKRARRRNQENDRSRQNYYSELNACMSSY